MFENMEPKIVKNILSAEEVAEIQELSRNTDRTLLVERLGHKAFFFNLPIMVKNKIENYVQENFGLDWVLHGASYAVYSTEWGYVPKLFPHIDGTFESHRVTLDIQLHSEGRGWEIFVEDKGYMLEDRDALLFSGTDQVHWREDRKILDEERYEMLFCHFENKNISFPDHWKEYIDERTKYWESLYPIPIKPIEL